MFFRIIKKIVQKYKKYAIQQCILAFLLQKTSQRYVFFYYQPIYLVGYFRKK